MQSDTQSKNGIKNADANATHKRLVLIVIKLLCTKFNEYAHKLHGVNADYNLLSSYSQTKAN